MTLTLLSSLDLFYTSCMTRIIVIGGGPSGLLAAGRAAEALGGGNALLLEKTGRIGSKLLLTGQGRCNLTHEGGIPDFIPRYNDGRFLYHAFSRFFREDLLDLLARWGLKAVAEADGRIFPATGKSQDVLAALEKHALESGVGIRTGIGANGILIENGAVRGVAADDDTLFQADAVILATGGCSYSATGSTGDGYRLAERSGHSIVPLRPALVPLEIREAALAKSLQGLSLAGVRLTSFRGGAGHVTPAMVPDRDYGRGIAGKKASGTLIESRRGDVLFTHFGISGPAVLLMSLAVVDSLGSGPVGLALDLKPDKKPEELRHELQALFDAAGKRKLSNLLESQVPGRLSGALVSLSGIDSDIEGHEISAEEREKLAVLLKCLKFNVVGPLSMDAAMVIAGGVSLDEIDPRTMGSKLVRGLYFCGEVMDIDGESGGYNLQAAFSTGFLAGESAAKHI